MYFDIILSHTYKLCSHHDHEDTFTTTFPPTELPRGCSGKTPPVCAGDTNELGSIPQ